MDRNKSKIKIEINKAINSISNITKPSSLTRNKLESLNRQIHPERTQSVHQTLLDVRCNKYFIKTQYNKDLKHDLYRSPYTHFFYPESNLQCHPPSPILRELQEKANILFSEYARLYYGEDQCIANCYVHEGQDGLNFTFFLKKQYSSAECKGVWCSSNIIEARGDPQKSITYKLQASILYELSIKDDLNNDSLQIFGSNKKSVQSKRITPEFEIDQFHLFIVGKMVEEMQTTLRQQIDLVYLGKTKDILFNTRFAETKSKEENLRLQAKQLCKMRSENPYVIDY